MQRARTSFRLLASAAVAIAAAAIAAAAGAAADDSGHPYRELDDRREGVLARPEIEPGRKITLYSLRVENDEEPAADPADSLRVAFWMPDSARVKVAVRHYASRYKMEVRAEVPEGRWQFSWPRDIVRDLGLERADLTPLASYDVRSEKTICPAVVFCGRPLVDEIRYVFSVVPRVPVALFDWEIREAGGNRVAVSGTLRGIPSDAPFELSWTPRRGEEEPDPPGKYVFFMKTSFRPQPGTPAGKVIMRYPFHHLPEKIASLFPASD